MKRLQSILPLTLVCVGVAFAQDGKQSASQVEGNGVSLLQGVGRRQEFIRGQSIILNVAYSARAALVTCVTFPEKSLKSIVAAWPESSVSLEHSGGNLFVKLLQEREGNVDVVGASGGLYRLYVKPTTAGPYDETLEIAVAAKETSLDGEMQPRPISAGARSAALDLIVAMRRGEVPDGALVSAGPDHAVSASSHRAAEMFIRLVYELDGFVGYVVELRNRSESEVSLDLSRYQQSDGLLLLLIGAREMSVPPGGATLLYLVFSEEL